MKDIFETNFSRNLSVICLISAPTLFVVSSITALITKEFNFTSYISGKSATAMFVFAVFVLIQMLRPKLEKLALIAGGVAIVGAISLSTITSFAYLGHEVKNSGIEVATIQSVMPLLRQVYMTIVTVPLPGLFFPIGLLALSIGLFAKKTVSRPISIVLAVAAISFPIGRISANMTIFLITDILLLIALGSIAWEILGSTQNEQTQLGYSNA